MSRTLPNGHQSGWQTVLLYIACYLSWLGFSAIGLWLIFQIRLNLFDIAAYTIENPDTMQDDWLIRGIDRWAIYGMGMVWIVLIFLMEGYFRKGVEKAIFSQRFTRILIIVLLIAGLSYGLQILLE